MSTRLAWGRSFWIDVEQMPVNSKVRTEYWSTSAMLEYGYNTAIYCNESNRMEVYLIFEQNENVYIYANGSGAYHSTYHDTVSGKYVLSTGIAGNVFTNFGTILTHFTDVTEFRNYIHTPIYNWQSVKSLKGINDFSISLPVLSNINDGNPVSGASSSAFTKAPSAENNIKNLVDITLKPVATDSSATIFYTIPVLKNDSYSSVKIYAKIGEVPKCDETDDIVEDIDPTINEISLENLEYESEYFFCIQSISNNGLKLSSNVESIMTGNPVPAEYRQYIDLINGCNGEGLDFFWKDYTINFPYGGYTDPKSFSYYNMRDSHYTVYNIVPEAFRSGYDDGYRYYTSHTTKFSLWIVNDNGTYKLYFRDYVPFIVGVNCSSFSSSTGLYSSGRYNQDGGQYYFQWYANSGRLVFPTGDNTVQRSENSLVSLMEWCSKTFRNVNIYVDGVLWSKANNTN